MNITENSWISTFSTIAQTLGAMVAVVATFVLVRLEKNSSNSDEHAILVREILPFLYKEKSKETFDGTSSTEVLEYLAEGLKRLNTQPPSLDKIDAGGLAEYFKKNKFDSAVEEAVKILGRKQEILISLAETRKFVLKRLQRTLIINAIIISLALFFLPQSNLFKNCHQYIVLYTMIGLTIFSIGYTVYSVQKILSYNYQKNKT